MKTDVITIRSDLDGSDLALMTAEKFSEYHDITGKDAMHLRLLTEETVSMVHGILVAANLSAESCRENRFAGMGRAGKIHYRKNRRCGNP